MVAARFISLPLFIFIEKPGPYPGIAQSLKNIDATKRRIRALSDPARRAAVQEAERAEVAAQTKADQAAAEAHAVRMEKLAAEKAEIEEQLAKFNAQEKKKRALWALEREVAEANSRGDNAAAKNALKKILHGDY